MTHENRYCQKKLDLCGAWRFAWTETPPDGIASLEAAQTAGLSFYPCDVPGNFELDLFKSGKAPDPFFGMNPVEVRRLTESCHVYYARKFDATPIEGAKPVLAFEGLDCFADVYLNGRLAASTDNMLIPHELDMSGFLLDGANELFVHIRPAVKEAEKHEYPQLLMHLGVNYESLYVRKAPHMYGWDIMPRFVSAGIFRPVWLEYRPNEGIEELYLRTAALSPDGKTATMILHYRLRAAQAGGYTVKLRMEHGGQVVEAETGVQFTAGKLRFDITDPHLWRPRGRGDACLYDVEVSLGRSGDPLDTVRFRFGVRTVELKRTALVTDEGGEFVFLVNGEKIFAKGTNWVPADAFHSRDRERIPAILDMVNDLNCNMVRCWGGNVYEDELFYDICDRSGLLVWQDFCMACGIYPQDGEFAGVIAQEASTVIKRLRHHACVALWSGDNECDESYAWGLTGADPNGNVLTRKVLPEAVRLHDGSRPYIGSSPFHDVGAQAPGDEQRLPEMHLWGPRDYYKSRFYIESKCRFVSEIGYHGCPDPESVREFISQGSLWPGLGNGEWLLHCTSPVPEAHLYDYRVELMTKQVEELFTKAPDSLEEFAFASQAVQAEAKKFFIELFRMAKWRRTGILWWNVMDGWPQFSDAVVDYYFRKKLAYGFIKRSQQDVCVMLGEPESWKQDIVIVNDTREDKAIRVAVTDVDTGAAVFEGSFTAPADRSTAVGKIPYVRNQQRFFTIRWEGDTSGRNHYLAGQPPFDLEKYREWLLRAGMMPGREINSLS